VIGHLLDLGLTDYLEASRLQVALHQARVQDVIGDTLLLTEHLPVYTLGRTTRPEHVGEGWATGMINGIPVLSADRGGSVTYHGPGQLVGYPILRLRTYCDGPKAYVNCLEEVLIRALDTLGVPAGRRAWMPGVWVGERKIAAVGVRISQGVTRHGFALNVVNDLLPFAAIVPCGLAGAGMTSVALATGAALECEAMGRAVVGAFQEVFGLALQKERVAEWLASTGAGLAELECVSSKGA
jgi:lipoyl(octanoyl) transferase